MQLMESVTDLDDAVRRSQAHPIVIFKHSATCGASAAAFEEVRDLLALEPAAEVFIVSVQFGAMVSKEIGKRFSLRHESPQALVIYRGVLTWHASHYRVTRAELESALAAVADAAFRPVD